MGCDFVTVLNLEDNEKYYINGKYDYVEAVYSNDNESVCLCMQNLYNIFRVRCLQQFKFNEGDFVEIGKIVGTRNYNCYMNEI